jgi:hypothetical protein
MRRAPGSCNAYTQKTLNQRPPHLAWHPRLYGKLPRKVCVSLLAPRGTPTYFQTLAVLVESVALLPRAKAVSPNMYVGSVRINTVMSEPRGHSLISSVFQNNSRISVPFEL